MIIVGIATFGSLGGGLLLMLIGLSCLLTCIQARTMMKAEGPWGFSDEDAIDYSSSLYSPDEKPRKSSGRSEKRLERLRAQERAERLRIDRILTKVSQHGMQSLSWWEKRTLRKATEHQRQRDAQMGRTRRM